MIPKIFHHVWIGPKPMPKEEVEFRESFRRFHPDWDFMLWDNDELANLDMPENCLEAFNESNGKNQPPNPPCYACQADVVRAVAVLRYGGIYLDTDIECYKPIDDLITDETDFIGIQPHKGNWITNAFFGASKGFKLIEDLVKDIRPRPPAHNGPLFLTNHLYVFTKTPVGGRPEIRRPVHSMNSKNIKILSHTTWGLQHKDTYMRHYFKASWIDKSK